MIRDIEITKRIVERFTQEFLSNVQVDVAIAGAGPSSLTAARLIAQAGKKVAVFERRLSVGGGMWGGGMMFPVIVVQPAGSRLLSDVGVSLREEGGYYTANSVESVTKLCSAAIDAGASIYTCMAVEDVVLVDQRVTGFVLNWTPALNSELPIDPLAIEAKLCIDATGHGCEIAHMVHDRGIQLRTPTGGISREGGMWAEMGERAVEEDTKEVYPGLIVAGMAATAVFGAPRMGPIFGGMLLSGKRAAEMSLDLL